MDFLREFFGYGGYERTPEGAYSWQHLLFVACFTLLTAAIAISLGVRNRRRDEKTKNRALVAAAILIDEFRKGVFGPLTIEYPPKEDTAELSARQAEAERQSGQRK